jgi:hypothetical protein
MNVDERQRARHVAVVLIGRRLYHLESHVGEGGGNRPGVVSPKRTQGDGVSRQARPGGVGAKERMGAQAMAPPGTYASRSEQG